MTERRDCWYSWVDKLGPGATEEDIREMIYDYQDHPPYYDDVEYDEDY